jgi:serine/threonine protein kinase
MSSEPRQVKPRHSRKEDVATTTNHVFQPLLLAGTGGIGDTWICVGNLPTTSSTSVINTVSKRDGHKTLYAVKLPSRGKLDPLPQEITALKHVATIPTPNNKHMQKYVDHDQLHKHATWLASQAVVGCTLWQLQKAAEAESIPLPKPLVLTIALQLCDALQALRDTQFFHGDLHGSNIMLDLEARDENGAPTVVVIDFGRGRPRKDAFEFDLDLSSFYRVVEGIASWEQGFKL